MPDVRVKAEREEVEKALRHLQLAYDAIRLAERTGVFLAPASKRLKFQLRGIRGLGDFLKDHLNEWRVAERALDHFKALIRRS